MKIIDKHTFDILTNTPWERFASPQTFCANFRIKSPTPLNSEYKITKILEEYFLSNSFKIKQLDKKTYKITITYMKSQFNINRAAYVKKLKMQIRNIKYDEFGICIEDDGISKKKILDQLDKDTARSILSVFFIYHLKFSQNDIAIFNYELLGPTEKLQNETYLEDMGITVDVGQKRNLRTRNPIESAKLEVTTRCPLIYFFNGPDCENYHKVKNLPCFNNFGSQIFLEYLNSDHKNLRLNGKILTDSYVAKITGEDRKTHAKEILNLFIQKKILILEDEKTRHFRLNRWDWVSL